MGIVEMFTAWRQPCPGCELRFEGTGFMAEDEHRYCTEECAQAQQVLIALDPSMLAHWRVENGEHRVKIIKHLGQKHIDYANTSISREMLVVEISPGQRRQWWVTPRMFNDLTKTGVYPGAFVTVSACPIGRCRIQ